jgi:hypothetical protein
MIIDLAMGPHPRSPGCSGDIGLGYYQNDGHFVLFHRGDKQAVVHAANKEKLMEHFGNLIDELLLRANVWETP